jgi:YD repeat-containing protein
MKERLLICTIKFFVVSCLSLLLFFPSVSFADQAQYFYDEIGRLARVVYASGNYLAYEYDDVGNLLLTVALMKNEWKAVGVGNSDLAKAFAHVMTDWPASKGYSYVFVRNYQTLSEFIILIHPQETSVIPLPNATKVWGTKGGKDSGAT